MSLTSTLVQLNKILCATCCHQAVSFERITWKCLYGFSFFSFSCRNGTFFLYGREVSPFRAVLCQSILSRLERERGGGGGHVCL